MVGRVSSPSPATPASPPLQVLRGREVPLGGLRAMKVRRTLPHRDRSFVGAWCFVDHYGPTEIASDGSGGMDVPPHPHTGLQTVSWLFDGVIEHRDSGGVHGLVRPGEVNLMTAGHGITHSEVSTEETRILHGVQLWVALPEHARDTERAFEHHAPPRVDLPGGAGTALVFAGALADPDAAPASPITTFTPLLGAQLDLEPGATLDLPVDRAFEHGLLVDTGSVSVAGATLRPGDLGCLDPGAAVLHLMAGDDGARVILLGGEPFEEEIIMWWNFVGRTHEEIERYRSEYEAGAARFGIVEGYAGEVDRIPAPPLPGVRLRPRGRRGKLPVPTPTKESTVSDRPTVEVTNNAEKKRFEARIEGELAGFAEYKLTDELIVFTHTEVFSAYEGKGVGGALARGALDEVRADGSRRVRPLCPFIKSWIAKHPDYIPLVEGA